MAKKKMSTGKKIAIGAGVVAVVGAVLCYFYCPCPFKKQPPAELPDDGLDSVGTQGLGSGLPFSVPQKQQPSYPKVLGQPGMEYQGRLETVII